MELSLDVRGQSHCPYALDVGGPWAEADPVERMSDGPDVGGIPDRAGALLRLR
jgi:hypothetical protein